MVRLIAVLLICVAAYAAPCVQASLASYEELGSTGCDIGPFTVKDFSYNLLAATVLIPDTAIQVIPAFSPNRFGLRFASQNFSVSGADFAHYLLAYTWDPGDIVSLEDILRANTPVFPGLVKITTDICKDAAFIGPVCPTSSTSITVSHNGIVANTFAAALFSPGIATVGIRETIELDANGASSQFSDFVNQLVAVPEPNFIVPVGLFVLAVLAASRFRLGTSVTSPRP